MILMGTAPTPDQPVIVTLREALGAAIDRRQVAILRAELADGERCADCGEPGERTGHMGCQYPQDRP